MNLSLRRPAFLFASSLTLCCLVPCGQAIGEFTTTLELQQPLENDQGIDTVRYTWSTNKTSGLVTQDDLITLTMDLLSAGTIIYTDQIYAGGTVQDIGGVARVQPADAAWIFDLDNLFLEDARNVGGTRAMAASDSTNPMATATYIIEDADGYQNSQNMAIFFFPVGGPVVNNSPGDVVISQTTVPEPSAFLLLMVLAGLTAMRRWYSCLTFGA